MAFKAILALVVSAVVALGSSDVRAEKDPPGVARVSIIDGPASYRLGSETDWTGVAVNAPLVTGDSFFAGEGARAEIQLAPGTYARLGSTTQLDLVELAPDAIQVRVVLGSAIVRLRDVPHRRHVELDTPAVALTLKRAGTYRVDVEAGGSTTVRIGRGEAVVHVGNDRFELYSRTSARIDPGGGAGAYRPVAYAGDDALDVWDRERDTRVESAQSFQHVSSEIYGVEDLDEHGSWEYHRGYGQLWRPTTVSVGWAPYRDGRWVWVEPWGWTWLDYAAWGWAPFHYGRWLFLDSSWYWAPGTVIARPVYAPALVGFYGYGAGFGWSASVSVGIGAGYVGWVPLGWGEPCYPWWGFGGARVGYAWWGGWGGPRVVNNVIVKQKNIYNINVRNVRHVNRRHRGGFTKVDRGDFGRGGRFVPVGERERRGFRAVAGRVGVTPTRTSRQAVQPSRASVGRVGRPPASTDRRGIRRTAVSEGARNRDTGGVRREGGAAVSRSDGRSRRAEIGSGRSASRSSARQADARRPSDRGTRSSLRSSPSPTRRSHAPSVVPRPPGRIDVSKSPSAPRRFARRSEPYVADRPRTPASRAGSWIGSTGSSSRSAVARRGQASNRGTAGPSRYTAARSNPRTEKTAVGRSSNRSWGGSSSRRVTSVRARGATGASRSSGERSTVRSLGTGGGLRRSTTASGGAPRLSSAPRRARSTVSAPRSASVRPTRAAPSSRSFVRGGASSVSRSSSRSSGGSRVGGARSFSNGRGRTSGSVRTSGGRGFGGPRSSGSFRGGATRRSAAGGGGRVSLGRR